MLLVEVSCYLAGGCDHAITRNNHHVPEIEISQLMIHSVFTFLESEPVSQKSRPREVATYNGISQARLLKGSR
ncbi:hypothetical protein NB16F81_50540 [Escherichia coli]